MSARTVAATGAACVLLAGCALSVRRGGELAVQAQRPVSPVLAAPVFVVRHAEKAAQPADDPPLAPAGSARAAALADVLRDAPLGAVVVTHRQRTRLTAEPALVGRGIAVHVVAFGAEGMPAHVGRVADTVRALARATGRAVLVVGHSNTVGPIVQALGGPAIGELCDSQYATLFTVAPQRGGVAVTRARYGAPDPDDPACGRGMRP